MAISMIASDCVAKNSGRRHSGDHQGGIDNILRGGRPLWNGLLRNGIALRILIVGRAVVRLLRPINGIATDD